MYIIHGKCKQCYYIFPFGGGHILKNQGFLTEFFRQLVIFMAGGFIYGAIEILYRGHTHPSMFITGGLCLVWVGGLNSFFKKDISVPVQMIIGAVIITAAEFICGVIVNIGFGMQVWDYSDLPFNIMGQVCLLFLCIWFLFSLPAILIEDFIRHGMFGGEKKRYVWKY